MLNYNCLSSCGAYTHFSPNMTCLTSCPNNYYQTSSTNTSTNTTTKHCSGCVSPCLDCTNSTFCLSCLTGFFYHNYGCGTTCAAGYFQDGTANTCNTCISPCQTCTSQSNCLTCSLGFWNGSHCAQSCPDGQFADGTTKSCAGCDPVCLTCANSASTCTSCNNSLSLLFYNSQCLTACPSRFYASNNTCSECIPPCYTCNDSTICLSCSFNYYLAGSCQSSCPAAYYQDDSTLTCLPCQSQCSTCLSAYACNTCLTGCLYSGQCPSACPDTSFFALTDNVTNSCVCEQCIYPCNTCF